MKRYKRAAWPHKLKSCPCLCDVAKVLMSKASLEKPSEEAKSSHSRATEGSGRGAKNQDQDFG